MSPTADLRDNEACWRAFATWCEGPLTLSEVALERTENAFIDTVACILSGARTDAAQKVASVCRDDKAGRAMALATAAHAEDFDDFDLPSVGHPSAVLVPVCLTLASSGRYAVEAYIVGLEMMIRLGQQMNPAHYARGWHATATIGAMGATAAAARLTHAPILTALSLAAGMAAGLKATFGSEAKPLNAGLAARAGIEAAALAKAGLTADPLAIWGAAGFIRLFGSPNPPPPQPFGAPLGVEAFGLYVKKYPACGYLARLIDAAIDIAATDKFRHEDIAHIEAEAPPRNADVISQSTWATAEEARFCPHYCLAVALTKGRLDPADFRGPALRDPATAALAARVTFRPAAAPQSDDDLSPSDPDHLTVHMKSGEVHARIARELTGGPDQPIAREALIDKLKNCAGHAYDPSQSEDLGALRSLKALDRITEPFASLFPKYPDPGPAAGPKARP